MSFFRKWTAANRGLTNGEVGLRWADLDWRPSRSNALSAWPLQVVYLSPIITSLFSCYCAAFNRTNYSTEYDTTLGSQGSVPPMRNEGNHYIPLAVRLPDIPSSFPFSYRLFFLLCVRTDASLQNVPLVWSPRGPSLSKCTWLLGLISIRRPNRINKISMPKWATNEPLSKEFTLLPTSFRPFVPALRAQFANRQKLGSNCCKNNLPHTSFSSF